MATYYPRCTVHLSVLFTGDDTVVRDLHVVPRRVEVQRNDHRTADTFIVELDYRDLPIDPRAVESMLVRVRMGDVGPAFGEGDEPALGDSQAMIIGYVDDPETALAEDAETVKLTGRDYTAILLDHEWQGETIRIDRSLRRVVESIVDTVPGARGRLQVAFQPADLAGLVLSDQVNRTRWVPADRDDAWTVLCDLLGRVALVPVMELDTLVVRSPNAVGPRSARLMYGNNVERLTFRRKSKEIRSKRVRAVAFDVVNRVTRTAEYPTTPATRQTVGADGQVRTEPTKATPWFLPDGSWTQAQVAEAARSVWEEGSRQYVEGDLETREMRAPGLKDEPDTDLTQIANGDELVVLLEPTGDERRFSNSKSAAATVHELTDGPQRLQKSVALALVEARERTREFSPAFYVLRAHHEWDREQGYRLRVEFVNRVVVRQGAVQVSDVSPPPSARAAAAPAPFRMAVLPPLRLPR